MRFLQRAYSFTQEYIGEFQTWFKTRNNCVSLHQKQRCRKHVLIFLNFSVMWDVFVDKSSFFVYSGARGCIQRCGCCSCWRRSAKRHWTLQCTCKWSRVGVMSWPNVWCAMRWSDSRPMRPVTPSNFSRKPCLSVESPLRPSTTCASTLSTTLRMLSRYQLKQSDFCYRTSDGLIPAIGRCVTIWSWNSFVHESESV